MDQMTIFDFMEQEEHTELDNLDEAQMVAIVGRAAGLHFEWDDFFKDYRAKNGKKRYSIRYSKFSVEPFSKFISCGYDYGTGGVHGPAYNVDEAIKFFRAHRSGGNNERRIKTLSLLWE